MIIDIKSGFCWRLIVVYGSPYENCKTNFLEELHVVMHNEWQGPTIIAGDFNLVHLATDKKVTRWLTIEWIHKWTLGELSASNRLFT